MPTLCISKKKIDKTETNYTRNIITVPLIFISSSASGGRLGEWKASKAPESAFILLLPLNNLLWK